jgi:hypothetical protein
MIYVQRSRQDIFPSLCVDEDSRRRPAADFDGVVNETTAFGARTPLPVFLITYNMCST